MNERELDGKVAVITGASKGLGKAMALASPPRMNQTETLRFRLAAAMVTADKQIGPGPSFSKRRRTKPRNSSGPSLRVLLLFGSKKDQAEGCDGDL
jgi:hypothetical protein